MIKAFVFDAYGTLFDPQSIWHSVEEAFPGHGMFITSVWRQKQLEYTWQRTVMDHFADFATVTREALDYAIKTVAPDPDVQVIDSLCAGFNRLELYSDAKEALTSLKRHRLAILSNGSQAMLGTLLSNAGLDGVFECVVSSDSVRKYKPCPAIYRAVAAKLDLPPDQIALVSSNGFDLAGARHFGLRTLRIERISPDRLRRSFATSTSITAESAFLALRSQMDEFAGQSDFTCASLRDIAEIAASNAAIRNPEDR
ncbi:haloacid dehalogenase type II [Labrys okinawensis]|uniref:haloacid dehalogenase type II n=1 Tax=Labrys okinawensis TaxID=346911 RepID=UPI0039BCB700